MVDINFVKVNGSKRTVSGAAGDNVMQVALAADIAEIIADCGGAMSCATCHVHVAPEWLAVTGAATGDEVAMLEMAIDPDETSRLSCQIELTEEMDGLVVNLPASQF